MQEVSIVYQWVNLPLANALLFSMAGAFFIALCVIRRIRDKNANNKN